MGISVFPQDGQTVEELFKNADAALYHAKDSGRDCFQFFSSSLNEAALQRLLLEGHLRRAVQRRSGGISRATVSPWRPSLHG